MKQKNWPYDELISLASAVVKQESAMVFLHSSKAYDYSGRYSILAFNEHDKVSDRFEHLEARLSHDKAPFDNAYFGYMSYELKHQLEQLRIDEEAFIKTPDLLFCRFNLIFHFDHQLQQCVLHYQDDASLEAIPALQDGSSEGSWAVENLQSNMTKESYLEAVNQTLEAIHRGDLYQANITRKFYGHFSQLSSPFDLFLKLSELSPAPYSAYMRFDDVHILSSSPEKFISIDTTGEVLAQPIKGSAKRFKDAKEDKHSVEQLKHSDKDKAENLMIVDLMRHDLAKTAVDGSVSVPSLYDIHSYETIHHMSSIIKSQKADAYSSLDVVKGCFPPGSMTGAPKIQAMTLCSQLEQWKRGIYSGALGCFGGDGSLDLSVVIRTIIIQDDRFEFQVGGAIVADSDPEKEWQETLNKAEAICRALDISIDA